MKSLQIPTVLITGMRWSGIGTVWAACYLDFYLCPNFQPRTQHTAGSLHRVLMSSQGKAFPPLGSSSVKICIAEDPTQVSTSLEH